MKYFLNDPGSYVYPGTYVPVLEEKVVAEVINGPSMFQSTLPVAKITEQPDSYKIVIKIPGKKRENFFIQVEGNILSVSVISREDSNGKKGYEIENRNIECLHRNIILPEVADTEFSIAEYRDSILYIYVMKAKKPVKNLPGNIVVY